MNIIKYTLAKMAEKITGRKCIRCRYRTGCRCCHPDGSMFDKCWQSLTRPGFEKRPPRYLRAKPNVGTQGVGVKPAPLTTEQKLQLERIKETLQQAEDTARESGLLED